MRDTCIIGAGPAGLAAARALKERNLPYTQIERNSGVGGLWDIDAEGSPMYESAHFISSKYTSHFYGFPMPADESLRVTAAHELFHAVQFGMDKKFKIYGGYWMHEDALPQMDDRAIGMIGTLTPARAPISRAYMPPALITMLVSITP